MTGAPLTRIELIEQLARKLGREPSLVELARWLRDHGEDDADIRQVIADAEAEEREGGHAPTRK